MATPTTARRLNNRGKPPLKPAPQPGELNEREKVVFVLAIDVDPNVYTGKIKQLFDQIYSKVER